MFLDDRDTNGPEGARHGQPAETGSRTSAVPGLAGDTAVLLARVGEAITDLIAGVDAEQLLGLSGDQLLDVLQGFERCRNRMGLVDQHLVHAVQTSELPSRLEYRTVGKMLHSCLRIPWGEACGRVRAAQGLRAGVSMSGESLEPKFAKLAAVVASGEVAPGQADQALRCLRKIEQLPWTGPDDLVEAEEALAEPAAIFDPSEYRAITHRVLDHVHPDGTLADDQIHQSRRSVGLVRCRDGSWKLEGRLTPLLGQKIAAVLAPLTKPQDGVDGEDPRTPGQRTHDALEAVFDRLLRRSDNPDCGGTPMTIIVTIDYESLVHDTGAGYLADGTPIAPRTLLRAAAQADIIPVVLDAGGAVLDVGRTRRIATLDQTRGLIARDKGCSFPSCDRTPDYCERHHILAWILGGETAIWNLTLLCPFHHHSFEQAGWECRMINGLPWWIPPRWIDREQKPLINPRIKPPNLHPPEPDPDCAG